MRFVPLCVAMGLTCSALSCSRQEPSRGLSTIHGTISEIDLLHRTMTLQFFVKQPAETTNLRVKIPAQTEIMVHGVVASLEFLRVGQTIMGLAELDRVGDDKALTMIKIFLDEPVAESTLMSSHAPE